MPPSRRLDLKTCAMKTLMLLLLATACRKRELMLMDISPQHMMIDNDVITFSLVAPCKNFVPSNPNKGFQLIYVRKNMVEPTLCPYTHVLDYMSLTKFKRASTSLFVSSNVPYKAAKAGTLLNWGKKMLQQAGVDTRLFKPHSTRSSATSCLFSGGLPLDIILGWARWSSLDSFAKTYHRQLLSADSVTFRRQQDFLLRTRNVAPNFHDQTEAFLRTGLFPVVQDNTPIAPIPPMQRHCHAKRRKNRYNDLKYSSLHTARALVKKSKQRGKKVVSKPLSPPKRKKPHISIVLLNSTSTDGYSEDDCIMIEKGSEPEIIEIPMSPDISDDDRPLINLLHTSSPRASLEQHTTDTDIPCPISQEDISCQEIMLPDSTADLDVDQLPDMVIPGTDNCAEHNSAVIEDIVNRLDSSEFHCQTLISKSDPQRCIPSSANPLESIPQQASKIQVTSHSSTHVKVVWSHPRDSSACTTL